jgi:hypothetical protein
MVVTIVAIKYVKETFKFYVTIKYTKGGTRMNKILPLIVVAILVLGCFGAVGTTNDSERQLYMINETTEISFDDEIDQYQRHSCW